METERISSLLNLTKKKQVRGKEQKSKNCKNWSETRSVRERE